MKLQYIVLIVAASIIVLVLIYKNSKKKLSPAKEQSSISEHTPDLLIYHEVGNSSDDDDKSVTATHYSNYNEIPLLVDEVDWGMVQIVYDKPIKSRIMKKKWRFSLKNWNLKPDDEIVLMFNDMVSLNNSKNKEPSTQFNILYKHNSWIVEAYVKGSFQQLLVFSINTNLEFESQNEETTVTVKFEPRKKINFNLNQQLEQFFSNVEESFKFSNPASHFFEINLKNAFSTSVQQIKVVLRSPGFFEYFKLADDLVTDRTLEVSALDCNTLTIQPEGDKYTMQLKNSNDEKVRQKMTAKRSIKLIWRKQSVITGIISKVVKTVP